MIETWDACNPQCGTRNGYLHMWRRGKRPCRECKHAANVYEQENKRRRVAMENKPSVQSYCFSVLEVHWPQYMTVQEIQDRVEVLFPNVNVNTVRRGLYRLLKAGKVDLFGSRWRANV